MSYTANDVKELREMTNLGMLECKKALDEAGGDKQKAVKILKDKGLAVAGSRADRDAKEGLISLINKGSSAFMVKLSSETDFVAKNASFIGILKSLIDGFSSKGESWISGEEPKSMITEFSGKTGEKIELKQFASLNNVKGFAASYLHTNSKVGVLLEIKGDDSIAADAEIQELGKDLCMQIAAMNPLATTPEDLSEEIKTEQKNSLLQQMADDKKPESIKEKIVEGKMRKFYEEKCLMNMAFVKDDKLVVGDLVSALAKKTGKEIGIGRFFRFQIGG